MDNTRQLAGKGLQYLFIGQIAVFFAFIPFLGTIILLAATILSIYGLYTLSKATQDYRTACMLALLNAVVSIFHQFFSRGFMDLLLSLVSSIISFLIVYLVCTSTAHLLEGISTQLVARANLIWKLYALCTLVLVACEVISHVPIIKYLTIPVTFLIAIVQIVAQILYLIFIWRSQKVLQA